MVETITCQHTVRTRGLPHHRVARCCVKTARWNVVVFINPDTKPLVADNYDTSKISRDYFLCGTHKNKVLGQFPVKEGAVWWAKATPMHQTGA